MGDWSPWGVTVDALMDQVARWLGGFAASVINTVWGWLSATVLLVPNVTVLPQVQAIHDRSLAIVNVCFILAIVAVAVAVMARGTIQLRYGVADLVPQLVFGFVAANFAIPLCQALIRFTNAVTHAVTGQDVASDASLGQMRRIVEGSLSNPALGLLTTLVSLTIAALVVWIIVGWIVRLGLLIVLVGIAPIALACHATPWTDPAARLWWRAFLGALGTVAAQAVALHTAAVIYLSPDAQVEQLGLPTDPTEVFNLFVIACILFAVAKVPGLIRQYVTHNRGNNMLGMILRVAVVQQVARAVTGGLWRGGRAGTVAAAAGRGAGFARGGTGRLPRPTLAPLRPSLRRRPGGMPVPAPSSAPVAGASSAGVVSTSRVAADGGVGAAHTRPRPVVPSHVTPGTAMPRKAARWPRPWAHTDSGTGWPADLAQGPQPSTALAYQRAVPAALAASTHGSALLTMREPIAGAAAATPAGVVPAGRRATGTGWPVLPDRAARTRPRDQPQLWPDTQPKWPRPAGWRAPPPSATPPSRTR
ncbi:hypothetical protein [Phytohabitans houttuyneae]|uniref:Uncharacterized protein n=1 Tax=Phytohabitans houttuyneae TaxID=1076126 RepID=A0A6V8K6Q9_9ACTN|nr:hypothetical protein [Phytohabitans houttuyneae]GFJ77437.1 hypothetical protein Phou_016170 [Phytohabitans houttuyneae]